MEEKFGKLLEQVGGFLRLDEILFSFFFFVGFTYAQHLANEGTIILR